MLLKWNDQGSLENLSVDGRNLIEPWGIEFADSNSFFSLEEGGWRSIRKEVTIQKEAKKLKGSMKVELSEGMFKLNFSDSVENNSIIRIASLVAIQDSWLLDFVLRFRFKKKYFHSAIIANQTIKHSNSNIYHQFPTNRVNLIGDKNTLQVNLTESKHPSNFSPFMYVRDSGDEWIVHCRLLPSSPKKVILKLNVPWYNRALPDSASHYILYSNRLKQSLMYRGERRRFSKVNIIGRFFKPSAYPMVRMDKFDTLKLSTTFHIKNS